MSLRSQTYSTPGSYTWTAPAGVEAVIVQILGGGSGGGSGNGSSGVGGGGGGSGQWWHNKLIPCAGGSLAIVVGAAGIGGDYSGLGRTDGGDSSVAEVRAFGSKINVGPNAGGSGGGLRGGSYSIPANPGFWGTADAPHSFGGGGGGSHNGEFPFPTTGAPGCATVASGGTTGVPPGPYATGNGCAGASSPFGRGGNGGNRSLSAPILSGEDAPATSYGAGGGGGGSASSGDYGVVGQTGGDGMGGIVILMWFEP